MIADGTLPRGPLLPAGRDRRADPDAGRAARRRGAARAPFPPPLRARAEPVGASGFAPDALAAIDDYRWPGNVRELENRIKRAVIMADGKLIAAADLDLAAPARPSEAQPINLRAAREAADRTRHPPGAGPHREQYLGRRQAARDQPADALRSDEAISPVGLSAGQKISGTLAVVTASDAGKRARVSASITALRNCARVVACAAGEPVDDRRGCRRRCRAPKSSGA